ncbi:MAG TPA: hypothetical protein VGD67_28905 [Pseudonocardiaceae bacterium]
MSKAPELATADLPPIVLPSTDELPPLLQDSDFWTDDMVAAAGIQVHDVPFVSIGGGMGSFVTVNYLRVAGGVPASDIKVLSNLSHPWQTYEYLTRVSQLSRRQRIRSDSQSRPDNLWGFPSYALQEALVKKSPKPLAQVLLEPVFADFYTPELDVVLKGIEREAGRIGYWDMLVQGEARLVRRRTGGGYYVLHAPRRPDGHNSGLIAFRARDVHIAVGYSGLRFLPDLQDFRARMNDYHHVVNAYEDHEHVYEALRRKPGRVVIRGGGIVTSAVLHRLIEDRRKYGLHTEIVHVFRTFYEGKHGPNQWWRRRGKHGFAYQGFNYPKSAWGGQLWSAMRRTEGDQRIKLYDLIGGTTTAWRRHWQEGLELARREGWYRTQSGQMAGLRLDGDQVVARVNVPNGSLDIAADYVIDCTGLDGDVAEHRILGDLLEHGGAGRNPMGRLDVERTFELRGSTNGMGMIYVSGAAAFGGYFPGVDTFLGLQIAAREIADDLARRGMARKMRPLRSISQWTKWVRNRRV